MSDLIVKVKVSEAIVVDLSPRLVAQLAASAATDATRKALKA